LILAGNFVQNHPFAMSAIDFAHVKKVVDWRPTAAGHPSSKSPGQARFGSKKPPTTKA
jgi:hypothetical protein